MIAVGILGYVLRKADLLVLALILGPQLETSFRQSLMASHGSLATFVTRPLAAGMLVAVMAVLVALVAWRMWKRFGAPTNPSPLPPARPGVDDLGMTIPYPAYQRESKYRWQR